MARKGSQEQASNVAESTMAEPSATIQDETVDGSEVESIDGAADSVDEGESSEGTTTEDGSGTVESGAEGDKPKRERSASNHIRLELPTDAHRKLRMIAANDGVRISEVSKRLSESLTANVATFLDTEYTRAVGK